LTRVAVLIPAYNEADRVEATVKAALSIDGVDEVVVIDDGSTDDTSNVASAAGAKVITLERNIGKGGAVNCGIEAVDADVYLMIDADLGECASATADLLEPVVAGQADMSIAAMRAPADHKGGFGCVKRLARWAIRKYGGITVTSPISGQRAMTRDLIRRIGGFESGFGLETALTIDAARHGFRIVEVSLPLTHRVTGRNLAGFMHRGRQFTDILRVVIRRSLGKTYGK